MVQCQAWYGGVSLVWYGRYGAAALPGEANHAHSIATTPREALLHLNILDIYSFVPLCSKKMSPALQLHQHMRYAAKVPD